MTVGDEWTLADASCFNVETCMYIRDKGYLETLFNPDMCRVRNKDLMLLIKQASTSLRTNIITVASQNVTE